MLLISIEYDSMDTNDVKDPTITQDETERTSGPSPVSHGSHSMGSLSLSSLGQSTSEDTSTSSSLDKVKQIKTVIFDWAGIFCNPGEPFAHPDLIAQTGLTVDEMGAATKELSNLYYRGKMTTYEFWKGVIQQFGLNDLTSGALGDAYLSSYTLYPGMLEFASGLRPRYRVVLLSNLTDLMMRDIMETHHIERYFDHLVFSNTIGIMKPEFGAYEAALAVAESTPRETLFIDDSLKNVEAAKSHGLSAFQFEGGSVPRMKECMKEFGIVTD